MKLIALAVVIAIFWALVWGSCGLGMALLGTKISPDTGHVPHGLVAVIVAFVSAATGFFSGMVYALLSRTMLTSMKRIVVGAAVGAGAIVTLLCTGAIINSSPANPLMGNLAQVVLPMLIAAPFTALLGGLLAAFDSKIWPQRESVRGELKTS